MRLFIGVSIGHEARQALISAANRMRKIADGRYVEPDMYHITLAFLGELEPGRTADVRSAMAEVAGCARRVPLALNRAGAFGRGESGILYGGVTGADALRTVADALRRALTARNLPFDPKPFKAHITLARRVKVTEALLGVPIAPVTFPADALTLFHSCRVGGALRYLPIHVAPFGEGDL